MNMILFKMSLLDHKPEINNLGRKTSDIHKNQAYVKRILLEKMLSRLRSPNGIEKWVYHWRCDFALFTHKKKGLREEMGKH